MRKRLDITLVEKGLARSRTQASELILAKHIRVDGAVAEKPSMSVTDDARIEVTEKLPYVGRGGLKLAHALKHFEINVAGLTAVDIGASTGGFTDCLLQNGVIKIYAIDVGHGQLVPELISDERVISMEGTDIRTAVVPEPVDIAVVDVSFISVTNILPKLSEILKNEGGAVVLIKPQFEVGKGKLGKNGVVRDEALRQATIPTVISKGQELGLTCEGVIESPILGGAGNVEYLAYFKKTN